MKKYVKPDVLFEDFELSVGVAACTDVVINKEGNVIGYKTEGYQSIIQELGLFTGDQCALRPEDAGFEGYGFYGSSGTVFFGS